ncbi:MAG TPA: outer membrane beta-barrel protein [Bacteroidia bacterium]|nr:outer membrane beta-barrel protein [Bacteroidia bacterium]
MGQTADTNHVTSDPTYSKVTSTFKISGYVDVYAAAYSDSVGHGNFQKFSSTSPRSNSFGLNIAQITEQYTSEKIRSTATLQYGDLPSAAWSPIYNYVQEANVGVALSKKIWIDGGFFKTHIGTEAMLPKDNITSSVSVITFYEPWWQAGFRLTYTPIEKLQMALYLVNGYNEFVATNNRKSLGLALSYALGDKGSISYNNFISDNTPDNVKTTHSRFLNNFVFNYAFSKKVQLLFGFDLISQQHSDLKDSTKPAYANSLILTFKYQFTKHFGMYYRIEAFNDPQGFLTGVIVNTENQATGYMLTGITLGMEYKPTENSYIRLEGRAIQMNDTQDIFYTNGQYTSGRGEVMLNMGVWF